MRENLTKYKDLVKTVLEENPLSRNDDVILFSKIIIKKGYNLNYLTVSEFLLRIRSGELPSMDTISRCRRKIQEKHVHLRGTLWNKRHSLQDSVKEQLEMFD